MPTIEINSENCKAAAGENVLAIARRHGSNIWFVCDGRGLCQTCECRVLSGAENLSGLSNKEKSLIDEKRRRDGYRLACQARLVGKGKARLVSRAEELRSRAERILHPPEGSDTARDFVKLTGTMISFAQALLRGMPYAAVNFVPQIASHPPTISGVRAYIDDAIRTVEKTIDSLASPQSTD
jgi:ferredoxin